jgi:hypothetical protein
MTHDSTASGLRSLGSGQSSDLVGPGASTGQDGPDSGEDPYSPGLEPLSFLLGALIGLLSISVPLATVLSSRSPHPGLLNPDGPEPPAGIPSARAGESDRGDPGRVPQ